MRPEVDRKSPPTLEDYLVQLWAGRWLIGGWGLALLTFGLLVSLVLPPVYEASAIVLLQEPTSAISLDDRLSTLEILPESTQSLTRSFVPIALSDAVLGAVYDNFADEYRSLDHLRRDVQAEQVGDANVVYLIVNAPDPVIARDVANTWATEVKTHVNSLYLFDAATNVQLAAATNALETREAEYAAFKASDPRDLLQAELNMLNERYRRSLRDDQRYTLVLQNLDRIEANLQATPADAPAPAADVLLYVALQLQVIATLDELRVDAANTPLVAEVSALDGLTNAALLSRMAALRTDLNTLAANTGPLRDTLAEDIFALQAEITRVEATAYRISQARTNARTAFDILSTKQIELTSTADFTSRRVDIASQARTPDKPVWPSTLLNLFIGAVVGGFFGVSHVYFRAYFS